MTATVDAEKYPGLVLDDLEQRIPHLAQDATRAHYRLFDAARHNVWEKDWGWYCQELAIERAGNAWDTGWFDRLELRRVRYRGSPEDGQSVWTSEDLVRPENVPRGLAARRMAKRMVRPYTEWSHPKEFTLDYINRSSVHVPGMNGIRQGVIFIEEIAFIPVFYRFKVREIFDEVLAEREGVPSEQLSLF